jgi:allantoate deiminase
LANVDSKGITMAEAIRNFRGNPDMLGAAKCDPNRLLGYVEAHIEQGPVLEQKNLQVGVVTSIAGQQRAQVTFQGRAAHAGTTPMSLRKDALCAAAQFVLAVESLAQSRGGLVATIGEIAALPGATNVIPGEARLSLDVRHPEDSVRKEAVATLRQKAQAIADERKLRLSWNLAYEVPGVICDRRLSAILADVTKRHQPELALLHSGAGHDAAVMAAITPVTMLFVRCKEGLSHNPAESASAEDITMAIEVMGEFLQRLAGES